MELREAVRSRRSIRQFLPKPVDERIIEDLVADSRWAPSWGNTQCWEVLAATGQRLEEFKKRNRAALQSGKAASPDIPMPQVWPEAYLKRYKELGKSVLGALEIAREDTAARLDHFARMFGLFEAPSLVIIAVDKALALEYAMLDAGLFLQTFCLLAHDLGLGTCILAAAVSYPDIVREVFGVPAEKRLVMGVAVGWPDPAAPVNRFERMRGPTDNFTSWVK
jgi:nitroreductase